MFSLRYYGPEYNLKYYKSGNKNQTTKPSLSASKITSNKSIGFIFELSRRHKKENRSYFP